MSFFTSSIGVAVFLVVSVIGSADDGAAVSLEDKVAASLFASL